MSDVVDRARDLGVSALRLYGRAVYPFAKLTVEPSIRNLFRVRVTGRKRVPRTGAAIIAPNHLSFLDPLFVALVVPRLVTFIGKAEYWDSWTTRWWAELSGAIPVRREDGLAAEGSLKAGVEVLRRGWLLGIFPEGTRSPDGRLYKGKTGAARMALEAGCPVIPTGITGTRDVLPKDAKVPRLHPVSVRFGRPKWVPEEAREDAGILRAFTDEVMAEIQTLTGQVYRHRYAYTKRFSGAEPVPAWP